MKKIIPSLFIIFTLAGCSAKEVTFTIDPLPERIEIESSLVKDWFAQENYDKNDMDALIDARTDLGDNAPIRFTFKSSPSSKTAVAFIQEKGKSEIISVRLGSEREFELTNYKINTQYTVWVSNNVKDYRINDSAVTFATPDAHFRTISIEGVNNFRDLGDDKIIKQGLIYRSATFENNDIIDEKNPINISGYGLALLDRLHLKSEIDLRKDEEKSVSYIDKSYIHDGIKYLKAPLHYGGDNILTYNKGDYNNPATIKTIFDFLGDVNNYPIDFHCVRGTDRTGCLAFLIKGLLGYEWEALYRDYLFSNFYNIGTSVKKDNIYYSVNPNVTTKYGNVIEQTEGDTLQEKIYNYLSSDKVGVDSQVLDSIINILKV